MLQHVCSLQTVTVTQLNTRHSVLCEALRYIFASLRQSLAHVLLCCGCAAACNTRYVALPLHLSGRTHAGGATHISKVLLQVTHAPYAYVQV